MLLLCDGPRGTARCLLGGATTRIRSGLEFLVAQAQGQKGGRGVSSRVSHKVHGVVPEGISSRAGEDGIIRASSSVRGSRLAVGERGAAGRRRLTAVAKVRPGGLGEDWREMETELRCINCQVSGVAKCHSET